MKPEIKFCDGKKLVGVHLKMSTADYRIAELWENFGPGRKEIKNILSNDLISLAVYPPAYFTDYKPTCDSES